MKSILALIVAIAATVFTPDATAQTTAIDSVKTAVLKVVNLHCDNDMPTIKKRLLNQDGVDEVAFTDRNNERATFTIIYHSSAIDAATIEKAVESTPGCDDQSETPYRVVKERPRKKKKS